MMVHEHSICTLTEDGVGICRGDTGGPLTNDQGITVGIASWGVGCAGRAPDVYTSVFSVMDFIRHFTGIPN